MRNPFKRNRELSLPSEQHNVRPTAMTSSSGDETERGNWGRQMDFLLSCIGYAIGLGNLWRFPYLCMRNGGGAFLIPYFLFLLLGGVPLFFLELAIGQFASLSPLCIWRISPLFEGLGWAAVVVSGVGTIYYNVILAWVLYYLGHSFVAVLPWSNCNNPWNTPSCAERGSTLDNGLSSNMTNITDILVNRTDTGGGYVIDNYANSLNVTNNITVMTTKLRTPSEEFWQFQMLQLSPGIEEADGIRWQLLLCLLAAWLIAYLCLCKGIKSSGKVVYVTATVPYIFLTILLVRGLLLPGAIDGIKFYIIPDFQKLAHFNVWAEACLQIFYSLGPAWGGPITLASYNKFHNNCQRDAIIVPIVNCFTSFFGGFVIFSVIGFMAKEAGLPVKDVITSGPGLAFIAYPEALTKLPISPLWAVMFFLMLLALGLDTQFGMIETISSGCVDMFPKQLGSRKLLTTAVICIIGFLCGIPFVSRAGLYIFMIVDWYCAVVSVTLIAVMECLVLSYIYGWRRLYDDIEMMIGHRPSYWWALCWCIITPGTLLTVLIFSFFQLKEPVYGDYHYPWWGIMIGWIIALVSFIPIPLCAVVKIAKEKGSFVQRIQTLVQPTAEWGPAVPEYRASYKYNQLQGQTAVIYRPAANNPECSKVREAENL